MKANIVRIGNSRGIRIPKVVLEQAGLSDEVELSVNGETIVIRKSRSPREGWDTAFRAMHESQDDKLIIDIESKWDREEWKWE